MPTVSDKDGLQVLLGKLRNGEWHPKNLVFANEFNCSIRFSLDWAREYREPSYINHLVEAIPNEFARNALCKKIDRSFGLYIFEETGKLRFRKSSDSSLWDIDGFDAIRLTSCTKNTLFKVGSQKITKEEFLEVIVDGLIHFRHTLVDEEFTEIRRLMRQISHKNNDDH